MNAKSDDQRLQSESLEIEHLLGEIEQLVPAPAWQRVERVIARVVRLYGAGLARVLDHAREAGAVAASFDERIAADDLLASLLVLHGIHPLPVEERVRRALQSARFELGIADHELELVGVTDGRVELRAAQALGGGAMASRVAEGAVRRVIESVAPEVTAVDIRGLAPPADPTLVKLRIRREAP
jgi:hypothetical protein